MLLTARQQIGTCAMKPLDEGGVVDSRLNVYGVQNLKVADLSICPSPVGAVRLRTVFIMDFMLTCAASTLEHLLRCCPCG